MSVLYYFAADIPLEEQPNPYICLLSVNQALERGIELDLEMLEGIDRDKPETVLYCESKEKFAYPSFFSIQKEDFYEDIGTKKMFCIKMQWDFAEDTAPVVLDYIRRQMETCTELEIWSIWLGSEEGVPRQMKKPVYSIDELSVNILREFYRQEGDYRCMVVR